MKLLDRLTEETIDTRQLASMGTVTAQRLGVSRQKKHTPR